MVKSKMNNALLKYHSVSVSSGLEGATPHRLVQMLMEGALDKIATAKGQMLRNDVASKGGQISWAISIINGLKGSLDLRAGGEIARNLDDLYDYMTRRLVEANLRNDVSLLDEVGSLLMEIKLAWDAIPENVRNPEVVRQIPAVG